MTDVMSKLLAAVVVLCLLALVTATTVWLLVQLLMSLP
jgi:hypothetical protein